MWWSVALAQTASVFCGASTLTDSLPADGDVGVSPDAVVALQFGFGANCGIPVYDARIVGPDGRDVPFTESILDGSVAWLVPDRPLAPGHHVVELTGLGTGGSGGSTFTYGSGYGYGYGYGYTPGIPPLFAFDVGEGGPVPSPGEPDDVVFHLPRRCGTTFGTSPSATVSVDVAAPPGVDGPHRGVLRVRLLVDGIARGWQTLELYAFDGDRLGFRSGLSVPGGLHDLCVEAEVRDETGAVRGTTPRVCEHQRACPPTRPPTNCATGGPPAVPALVIALTLTRMSRSRRRGPARSA